MTWWGIPPVRTTLRKMPVGGAVSLEGEDSSIRESASELMVSVWVEERSRVVVVGGP